jgi:hypothetical protein
MSCKNCVNSIPNYTDLRHQNFGVCEAYNELCDIEKERIDLIFYIPLMDVKDVLHVVAMLKIF